MHKRGLCRHAVSVCVSVCVSVINGIAIFRREPPPLTGASNAGGVGRNRDSEPISGLTACVNAATGKCCQRGRRWRTASVSLGMTHRW